MARKSKETIFYEQMLTLSSCPKDLLKYITPDGDLLNLIDLCEKRDARALDTLTEELASKYFCSPDRGARCEAMEYLCTLGAEVGVDACLLRLTEYVCLCEEGFDLLLPYAHLLKECEAYRRAVIKARIRAIAGENAALLSREVIHLTDEDEAALSLFKLWVEGGKVSPELTELCRQVDCLSVLSLPALYKNEPAAVCEARGSARALSLILGASRLSTYEPWGELWLRLAYEHTVIYGGADLTEICPMAIKTVSRRKYDEKRSLHLLALTAYLMRRTPTEELSKSYYELDMQSRFDGNPPLCDGEQLEQIIKSAVYTSAEREMEMANRCKHLGAVITHAKNRFILECAPVGHGKRGKRHFWRQRISFPKSLGDSEPILKPFIIEEAHNDIARFGAVLRDEKCRSQIICRSELILGEEPHPFIADLVLDIAYISSVKCDTMEICIKDSIADGEYYIYDCIIYVY